MDIIQTENMVDYWQLQEQHAKTALEYAVQQRRYWVGQLVLARTVALDGTEAR